MKLIPIGVIRSPFKKAENTPIQPILLRQTGRVEVYKKYAAGLRDINGFSHIILLYEFRRSKGYNLLARPFLNRNQRGVFSTRFPKRPNQIGFSVGHYCGEKEISCLYRALTF